MSKFSGIVLASSLLALISGPAIAADGPVKVVASFSILGDFVRQVGGEHVDVVALVGPNGDAHVFAPSPADARKTAEADLVVVNGLGFEGWLDRLVEASGFAGPVLVASDGIETLAMEEEEEHEHEAEDHAHEHEHEAEEHAHEGGHDGHDHGAVDPHAWQAVANAEIYVKNIGDALCTADRDHCDAYRANAGRYTEELEGLDASIKADFAAIPAERRVVITSHDAFGYFGRAYGLKFLAPQGISTDSEASAAAIASLIEQIRHEGVTTLFVENISDPRLIEQIGRETGARPGGELYSDALSDASGPAADYLSMLRHNASVLLAAMQGS